MGAFLSSIQAAPGRPPPSQIIDVMSIYHPFPFRLDSLTKGGPVQYDACLQLGEFPSDRYKGNSAVVFFPLKASNNPGEKGRFMNNIATKIPDILNQQPNPITGYPDVPASTGANWNIEDILFMKDKAGQTVSRAFYAWINRTPFPVGVVVMAEPVYISQTDMNNILRLPITPPSDVIHEIGTPILYKPGPVFDENGNPQPCPETAAELSKKAFDSIKPIPGMEPKKTGTDPALLFQILLGFIGTIIIILGVWAGVKFAMGPGSTMMKSLGDTLGRSLAGGYDAIKKAKLPPIPKIPESVKESVNKTRRNLGNRLGLGATGKFGPKRPSPPPDAPIDEVLPVLKPSEDFEMTNPLFKSKDDFAKFQQRNRTRKNTKKGSIRDIANLPAANIPEPAPAPAPAAVPSLEKIVDDMPPGVTVNPVVNRRRSLQNKRKSSVNSIKNIPELTSLKPTENTPAAISNLPTPIVNPAVQEIESMQKSIDNRNKAKSSALRKISANSQSKKASFKNIVKRAQAVNEIDEWEPPAPAPAPAPPSASVPPPAPATAPESEVNKLWKRRFAKRDQQKANPKPVFKGGRKRRNRRKTANRKKTGRKI